MRHRGGKNEELKRGYRRIKNVRDVVRAGNRKQIGQEWRKRAKKL